MSIHVLNGYFVSFVASRDMMRDMRSLFGLPLVDVAFFLTLPQHIQLVWDKVRGSVLESRCCRGGVG